MSVEDVMIKEKIVSVRPSTSVREAARIMYENNIGSVLVMDNDRLVGIFTERDLVKVVAKGESLEEPVEKFMTKRVFTLKIGDSIWKALDVMAELGIRHLPIVDNKGKVIRIVSIRDLLNRLRLTEP
jgi:CBS domain-containing protein